MKIFVTGTRGIPNVQGGVETHCQELYPLIVKQGHEVTIACRPGYVSPEMEKTGYKGVRLVQVPSIKSKSLEAFIHTFFSIIKARFDKPDLVHIHAIGPGIMAPFARLLGLKVVVTNHGPDYDRQKWGRFAKRILKTGESWGTRFANQVIVISEPIKSTLEKLYKRFDTHLIYNGVNKPVIAASTSYIESLGVKPGYIFAAGRFVPEKGFLDLIQAWSELPGPKVQLVIAGDSDHESAHSREIKSTAQKAGVVLTGFVKGEKLNELFSNAGLFAMPSYHEGLPIALLEAISYGLKVVVSDIPANKAVDLSPDCFFKTGNIEQLRKTLDLKLHQQTQPDYSPLLQKYDWELISEQTEEVYKKCLNIR